MNFITQELRELFMKSIGRILEDCSRIAIDDDRPS